MPASLGLSKCADIDFSFSCEIMLQNDGKTVDSNYVADRLGSTSTLVRRMARTGTIPCDCIVCNSENGDQWEFDRQQIDVWIEKRLEAKKSRPAS